MAPFPSCRGIGAMGRRPELQAFSRTRRSSTHLFSVTSLRGLYRLGVLILILQFRTVLLVIGWAVVQKHEDPATSAPWRATGADTSAVSAFIQNQSHLQ